MATKHRPRHRRGGVSSDPLLRQAQLETNIRYDPEAGALRQLLQESKGAYKRGTHNEAAAASGIVAAARAAQPVVKKSYQQASDTITDTKAQVQGDTAGLSSAADPYKAAAAKEAAAAARRVSESAAAAQSELSGRQVDAEAGRQFAVKALGSKYAKDVHDIGQRKQQLAGEAAQFTLATLHDLEAADAEQKQKDKEYRLQVRKLNTDIELAQQRDATTRRGQSLAHGDRAEANRIRRENAKKNGKGGKPKFTPVQLRSARAQWHKGSLFAGEYKKAGALTEKNGNAIVSRLVSKGVDEPIARGVVQTHLFGGVRAPQRRALERDYGLKPKVISRRGTKPGLNPLNWK